MKTFKLEDERSIIVTEQDIMDIIFDVLSGSIPKWSDVEDTDGTCYVTNINNGRTYNHFYKVV